MRNVEEKEKTQKVRKQNYLIRLRKESKERKDKFTLGQQQEES